MKQILIHAANITERAEEGIKVIPNLYLYPPKKKPDFWKEFLTAPNKGVLASISYNKNDQQFIIYPGDIFTGIPVQYSEDKPPRFYAKGFFAGKVNADSVSTLENGNVKFTVGVYGKPDWVNVICFAKDKLANTVLKYAAGSNVAVAGTLSFRFFQQEGKEGRTFLNLNVDDFSLLGSASKAKKQEAASDYPDWKELEPVQF